MSRPARTARAAVFTVVILAAPASALAGEHVYSYEAASPAARVLAPTGLSFVFEKHTLGGVRIQRIIQTGERGSADVRPAPGADLGDLKAVLGAQPAGDLYEIELQGDGRAFVEAICPGSERAWLVISPMERFRDLKVQAVGRPAKGAPRHCVDLAFTFHSEWILPPSRLPPSPRFSGPP
jgi:hypothetical protein